jgi:uncharacterized CHY-type Zn-finger protein
MSILLTTDDVPSDRATKSLFSLAKLVGLRFVLWANTCSDYYAAAAVYEHLSRLSNAELERRGLDRSTLARVICDSCDRTTVR